MKTSPPIPAAEQARNQDDEERRAAQAAASIMITAPTTGEPKRLGDGRKGAGHRHQRQGSDRAPLS